jgi:hypothetical protein
MTGCETIYKLCDINEEKSLYLLHKVRHDGYLYLDFFKNYILKHTHDNVTNVNLIIREFEKYFFESDPSQNFMNGMQEDEIETSFPYGFIFIGSRNDNIDAATFGSFIENAFQEAHKSIRTFDDDDGLICRYSDYTLYINLLDETLHYVDDATQNYTKQFL